MLGFVIIAYNTFVKANALFFSIYAVQKHPNTFPMKPLRNTFPRYKAVLVMGNKGGEQLI